MTENENGIYVKKQLKVELLFRFYTNRVQVLFYIYATTVIKITLMKVKALKTDKEVKRLEDEKIVQLFLERDENAIKYSSEKYGARLRAIALGITSDFHTAEECENDTYLKAWGLIPPNEPRTYLFAFLARITRHISIDRCRERDSLKRKAFIAGLSEEMEMTIQSSDTVEGNWDAKELGEKISRFLKNQSKEKRVIFVRRYFYMDSISEICKRLAVSESKVKSVLFRVRNDLRKYLIREGYVL